MTIDEALAFARDLLDTHGLDDVAVEKAQAKTWYGQYHTNALTGASVIRLAEPLLALNPHQVEDTVRHEVAHAIAGIEAGHGPDWVAACRLTGAVPEEYADGKSVPPKWWAHCPNHGIVATRYRLSAAAERFVCGVCRRRLTWEENL